MTIPFSPPVPWPNCIYSIYFNEQKNAQNIGHHGHVVFSRGGGRKSSLFLKVNRDNLVGCNGVMEKHMKKFCCDHLAVFKAIT